MNECTIDYYPTQFDLIPNPIYIKLQYQQKYNYNKYCVKVLKSYTWYLLQRRYANIQLLTKVGTSKSICFNSLLLV